MFSFGENDLYDQVGNQTGSSLRQWQTKMKEYTRVAPVLFYGRGFGLLPHRRPIHTVCKLRNEIRHWEKESRISILISDTLVTLQQNACVNRGKRIRIPVSRKFNFCLWNPQSLALESRIQLKKSGIPQKIGIQDQISTYKDWNPRRGIQNPRLS